MYFEFEFGQFDFSYYFNSWSLHIWHFSVNSFHLIILIYQFYRRSRTLIVWFVKKLILHWIKILKWKTRRRCAKSIYVSSGDLSHNLREQIKFKYCANTNKKYNLEMILVFRFSWIVINLNHICICVSDCECLLCYAKRQQIHKPMQGLRFVWTNIRKIRTHWLYGADRKEVLKIQIESETQHYMVSFIW